ncbi:MAG: hypothetical protein ACLGQW_02050 [Acidobacteriota bacterium]
MSSSPSTFLMICLLLLLAAPSACHRGIDYTKFDPKCREWNGENGIMPSKSEFMQTNPDMNSYYEYFMCINLSYQHAAILVGIDFFLNNPGEFTRIAAGKMLASRSDKEMLLISHILLRIHEFKLYEIAGNEALMTTWATAIDKMDHNWTRQRSTEYYTAVSTNIKPSGHN